MKPVTLVTIALVMTVGCAPAMQPIDRTALESLTREPSIHAVHYKAPTFTILTPGRAALIGGLGAIGGGIAAAQMESEGKQLVKEYGLEDPSVFIKERLAAAIESHLKPSSITRVAQAFDRDDDGMDNLRRRFGNAVVLVNGALWDVRTGYLYATSEAEGVAKTLRPAMFARDDAAIVRAKQEAMRTFREELVRRLRRLSGG